jgi:predicted enzyme related to lactoylglutathione lyase
VLHRRHRLAHPQLTIQETIMNARLILCSVPTAAQESTASFYAQLLGSQLGRSLWDQGKSSYTWASSGVKLAVNERQHDREEVMLHFRVDDLDAAVKQLQAAGGQQVAGPYDLPVAKADLDGFRQSYEQLAFGPANEVEESLGTGVVVRDPEGNQVGLIQLRPYAEKFFDEGQVTRHQVLQHVVGIRNNSAR